MLLWNRLWTTFSVGEGNWGVVFCFSFLWHWWGSQHKGLSLQGFRKLHLLFLPNSGVELLPRIPGGQTVATQGRHSVSVLDFVSNNVSNTVSCWIVRPTPWGARLLHWWVIYTPRQMKEASGTWWDSSELVLHGGRRKHSFNNYWIANKSKKIEI